VADIFISYAREDSSRARALAVALERRDWSVWWDRRIPDGRDFNRYIEEKLAEASCVVVLWSTASVDSKFVRDEAAEGLNGRLVPALLEAVRPPLGFRQLQTANLVDWDGQESHEEFQHFVASIRTVLGSTQEPGPAQVEVVEARQGGSLQRRLGAKSAGAILLAGVAVVLGLMAWPIRRPDAADRANPVQGSPLAPSGRLGTTQNDQAVDLLATASRAENSRGFRDCSECPEMVTIPAGSFRMGSESTEPGRHPSEGPVRHVRIEAFAIGKYEVTRDEFQIYINETRRTVSGCVGTVEYPDQNWQHNAVSQTGRHPVICVNWPYRLATESEWEYAARATSGTTWPWGNDPGLTCLHANVADSEYKKRFSTASDLHECSDGHMFTAPVGAGRDNRFGLFDMIGNVSEWVEDCYYETYAGARSDGSARIETGCGSRIQRGGGWASGPSTNRSASHLGQKADHRGYSTGIRVARTLNAR
jgi:formylglycine-generating enzyme required for sulfatase activity